MGWSESYYADMKMEAEEELRAYSRPFLKALVDFREVVETYRDFAECANELELLLERLEGFLEGYLQA